MAAPSTDLPSSRAFVTQLLNSLHALPPPSVGTTNNAASNHLISAPEAVKKQLLTLHVLFPNEFLPALDLLDRHLVTRFRIRRNPVVAPAPHYGDVFAAQQAAQPTITVSETAQVQNQVAARSGLHEAQAEDGTGDENYPMLAHIPSVATLGHGDPPDADADGDSIMLDAGAGVGADYAAPHLEDLEEEPHRPRNSSGASHGIELEAAASRESGNGATTETSKDAAHLPQIRDAAETGTGAPQRIQNHSGDAHAKEEADTVYYVRSAQQRSSRYGSSIDSSASYEVRLRAWNCSCPAFAFSAFPSTHPEPRALEVAFDDALRGIVDAVGGDMQGEREEAWSFGGAGLGTGMPPVCKHLLACVLVERCPIFSGFVEGRDVSVEEAAGWAAGWGD